MAKSVPDTVKDAQLGAAEGSNISVCSAEPADPSGIAAVALADETLTTGDFTKANGDTSGRKTTIAAQSAVTVDATGTATHVVLHDGALAGSRQFVTTCTSTALTSGGTVDIGAFDIELRDPV